MCNFDYLQKFNLSSQDIHQIGIRRNDNGIRTDHCLVSCQTVKALKAGTAADARCQTPLIKICERPQPQVFSIHQYEKNNISEVQQKIQFFIVSPNRPRESLSCPLQLLTIIVPSIGLVLFLRF